MAFAFMKGDTRRHAVRITRDLGDNYALEIFPEVPADKPKIAEPFKNWPSPLVLKVMADSQEDALVAGLEHLVKLGKLERYEVAEHEKPKPAAPKVEKKDDEEA